MAVKQIVIHECDLCGEHVRPAQLSKITIQFSRFDACQKCTQAIHDALARLKYRAVEEQDAV